MRRHTVSVLTIRALLHYPLSNGRNIEEIRRLLLAMQTSDQY